VLTELKNRGLKDIFIACVDGLKGFPQAIETVYPKTTVQLCIVHMTRASLNYVSWKDRKEVAMDLKTSYRAATGEEALLASAVILSAMVRRYERRKGGRDAGPKRLLSGRQTQSSQTSRHTFTAIERSTEPQMKMPTSESAGQDLP
jgi:hypothetical protein